MEWRFENIQTIIIHHINVLISQFPPCICSRRCHGASVSHVWTVPHRRVRRNSVIIIHDIVHECQQFCSEKQGSALWHSVKSRLSREEVVM